MSKNVAILEVPTFGRPFKLGMLYDATTDRLIQDNELWDKETLQKAQQDKPYLDTKFSVIQDDSLASKCLHLGANSATLKANLFTGLTQVSGAAKFFVDHKTTREVVRVTVQLKCSSHTQEIDLQQLGQIQNQAAIGATRATHVVSKILSGLEAFLVIDRLYSADEDIGVIQEKITNCAQFLANMYDSGKCDLSEIDQKEAEKYSCKFYSDAPMPTASPSSFKDVVTVLEEHHKLFKQGSSCSCLVPKKVWLYPLSELDSSAPSIAQEVSEDIISHVEKITEDLNQAEVWISDISKNNAQASSTIPSFSEQQRRLAELIKRFRTDIVQQLSVAASNTRTGSLEKDQLSSLLQQVEDSPFCCSRIASLLKGIELEIRAVSQFLTSLSSDSVKSVSSDEIDALAIDFDYILSFEFRLGGTNTTYLSEMEEYLRTKAVSKQYSGACNKITPWYKDGSKKRAMQIKAKLFKEFALINSTRDDITFVIHITSDTPSPSKEGAAVVLYADDEPIDFDLPSKPLKLRITKDTGEEVHLAWNKLKHGQANVTSYEVSFRSINETSEDQMIVRTNEATESIAIQDLAPECVYEFSVQAECIAGLSPKSEPVARKPTKTKPKESDLTPQKESTYSSVVKKSLQSTGSPLPDRNKRPKQTSDSSFSAQSHLQYSASSTPEATNSGPIVLTLPPSHLGPHMLQAFEPIEFRLPPSTLAPWPSMGGQVFTSPSSVPAATTTASLQPERINQLRSAPDPPPVTTSRQTSEQTQCFNSSSTISFSPSPQKTEEPSLQSSTPISSPSPQIPSRSESQAVPASAWLKSDSMPLLELRDPNDKILITGSTDKNFEVPEYQMEKPQPKNVTYKSIGLEWKRPSFGRSTVQYYSVLYHIDGSPESTLREKKTNGAEEHITIDGLSCETGYIFRVQATFPSGIKLESEPTGTIQTKAHLAETIRLKSKLISQKTSKKPAIYELTKQQKMANDNKRMAKYEIGQPVGRDNMKVLMVVGATGAGKTTLINGIANYMYGVQWDDEFRFVLVANEPAKKSQAHSQTSWITAYTLHRGETSPIPYSLIIIDTPGFGDTEGIERDKKIADQIKDFFSVQPPEGIDILHGIGFVAQASLARLSPSQQYIFDSILSIYGRDVASNIFMMTTFADGQDPPVMEAIKVAEIPHQTYFKFNNSALFVTGKEDSFDAMFWKMGMKSFTDFFSDFGRAEHRSLQLTREVLSEREQLENVLKELQPQINAGLTKMDELQRVVTLLQHNKSLIEQNREFIIKVPITKQQKVDTPPGHYTTNCLNCNYTCHDNCAYADNADKRNCCAMDGRGNCTVCPGNCVWSKHVNNPYIFELYIEEEVRTSSELKDRYDTAREGESRAETMIGNIKDELNTLEIIVLDQVDKARRSLIRLDEIALKPNPLSEVDYIDQLIKSEEQQGKLGWQERVTAYKTLRKRAKLMRKIKDHKQVVNEPLFSWLGEDGARGSYAPATLNYLRNPRDPKKKTWYQFWK